jgi:hypothetical protein
VWPVSARLVVALALFCSIGVAAADTVGRGGVDFVGVSTACFLALSTISCCFFLSFARIGTKSGGTTVLSLKFSANFFRSFNLTALSRRARERWCSWAFIFSTAENCLNALTTSFSTVSVAATSLFTPRLLELVEGVLLLPLGVGSWAFSAEVLLDSVTLAG